MTRRPTAELRACSDEMLLRDCRWDAFRGPGPGGQKRNKTSSAVRLTHNPTGIAATAGERRSQQQNRDAALRRLRHRMLLELREPLDPETFQPPESFHLNVGPRAAHYLTIAGLVLDVLAACEWSVSDAARLLRVTTGALVRFLQNDQKLMAHVNEQRATAGLKTLGTR